MKSYLIMMAVRLLEMHRILKPTGSIYLHCDPTASHYLKLLMDAVFGQNNFRNEIVWCYRGGGSPKKDFGRRHDALLRYSKTSGYDFYPDAIRIPYQAEGIGRTDDAMWGKHKGTNKVYKPHPLGKVPEDWWPMNILNANDPERVGYPTQKPLNLLDRIIKASSNEGDMILDPLPVAPPPVLPPNGSTVNGSASTYPRKRPTLCRSASVRKSTCFTTSSRFADPTFQDGRTLANCPATGHTNTCFSESRKGIARDARFRSNSAISPWITSPLRAKAGPITWTTCNSCAGRAIP